MNNCNMTHAPPIYSLDPDKANKAVKTEVNVDINKYKSLKDLSEKLHNYRQGTTKDKPKKKKKQEVLASASSLGYVPQELIYAALEKCIASETFWSKAGLDQLLEDGYLTQGISDSLAFDCILKYKSFSSLKLLAKSLIVVAEKHIVQCLKHMIHMISADEVTSVYKSLKSDHCSIPEVIKDISYIVLLPVNKLKLKEYLKLLTVDEALLLLQCLHIFLIISSPALICNSSLAGYLDEEVTEIKAFNWLDMVLSAHLMTFMGSPTLNPIVKEIRWTTKRQQIYYSDVKKLGPCLQYITEAKTLPEKLIGEYSIETITL